VDDAGLKFPSLVRGGFFCAGEATTRRGGLMRIGWLLVNNSRRLDGRELVLVVGALPASRSDRTNEAGSRRDRAIDCLCATCNVRDRDRAAASNVPADKSCIFNRITDRAVRICEYSTIDSWASRSTFITCGGTQILSREIKFTGARRRIFWVARCDGGSGREPVTDRTLMGEGCIDVGRIRTTVGKRPGFDGWHRSRIFSDDYWRSIQGEFLDQIVASYESL